MTAEAFTLRDVKLFQAGMCHARDIAQRTTKEKISTVIQRHITDNDLLTEQCIRKGVFSPPHATKTTAGRWLCATLLAFAVVYLFAWVANGALKRVDEANLESGAAIFGTDYFPPEEQ